MTHRGRVRNICDGHQGWGRGVAAEDDVEGLIRLDMRGQKRVEVGCERRVARRGSKKSQGLQLLGLDRDQQSKVLVGREQLVELGDQLLRGWTASARLG